MCISVFRCEQNVCHFICDFVGTMAPQGQGIRFGQQQPQMKRCEHNQVSEYSANVLTHLSIQRKATGTQASRPFQIGRHTSLKGNDRHSSPCWGKGRASECSKVPSDWQHGTVQSLCPFAEDREFPRKKQAWAHAQFCSSLLCFHDHSLGSLIQHVL